MRSLIAVCVGGGGEGRGGGGVMCIMIYYNLITVHSSV